MAAGLLAACGGQAGGGSAVTVLAAASLAGVFDDLGAAFSAQEGAPPVRFSFAASSVIAAQVRGGAPADVLATADSETMATVAATGRVGEPVSFARNRLAMVVPGGNPERIATLADLARPGLAVVVCAPEVPCGHLAAEALARAGVDLRPRSHEADVRAVVARVAQGEADAGIVYVTDVIGAGPRVEGVAIPADHNVETRYPIAVLTSARDPAGARAFVAFVLSAPGQAILARAGFEQP